jgi:hypothetical protein
MNTSKKLSLPVYRYALGVYKGSGETLGNIAADARSFELDLNCWIDMLNLREGLVR